MAHTKSGGSTKLGRDSAAQRLGVKIQDGQPVRAGQIIIRQRGTRYLPGANIRRGGDDTLYAAASGTVKYSVRQKTRFDGSQRRATVVGVRAV
ncbi:MAG: 50S ribosomal protein L27 [Candidatus Liptonbacteria bacterium]|nr:50S ribosomal protein L27 [Candidatus Liptonbacteria bacterium]